MKQLIEFQEFRNSDALTFGLKVVNKIQQNQLKPVRIRVVYENDIIFQYMMDGKKDDKWLNKKQRTVLETKHSSLYVYEHQDEFQLDDSYAICGGGYPLIVNGELKGVFIVSGLRHDEDHQLIVDVLKEMEEER